MACGVCGGSGQQGGDGYWIYCDCENGRNKKMNDALVLTDESGGKQ